MMLRCSCSHTHPTSPHGPHLVGLVEEAAPAPLEQELNVLVNTAARKLSGQIVSEIKITHTYRRRKIETRTWQKHEKK